MNKFSLGLKKDIEDNRDYIFKTVLPIKSKLPDNVDLRKDMPSIFSQNNQGSCTANAGVAVMEYLYNVMKGEKYILSRQYLYNMERINDNCPLENDEGSSMRQICKTLKKNGVCEENYFTYGNGNEKIEPSIMAKTNALFFQAVTYYRCQTLKDIRIALSNGFPVLVGTEVWSSLWRTDENGIVPEINKENDELEGGHAWVITGYNTDENGTITYTLRTSWGKSIKSQKSWGYAYNNPSDAGFGDDGYCYMSEKLLKDILIDAWVITEIKE